MLFSLVMQSLSCSLRRFSRLASSSSSGLATTASVCCVDDELPGRFTDTSLQLCVACEGQQRYYVVSGVERLQADIASVRRGAVADWAGHPLGLRCGEDGLTSEIHVDERDAWKGRLPGQATTTTID